VEEIIEEPVEEPAAEPAPVDDYPAGNPFAKADSADDCTRRINLDDLKFGRNYSGE